MRIEVWSDIACPWCYVGKRRFEAALSQFEHAAEVEVVWRSFQLDPAAPARPDGTYVSRLARKYRVTEDEAAAMVDRMVQAGAASGVEFRFDRAGPGNTFDAHRVLHLAARRGRQPEVNERLMAAAFTDGTVLSDHRALVAAAAEAGLDAGEVTEVLESGAYADDVLADRAEAEAYGIEGVPFFVVDGEYGIRGAQPPDRMLEALRQIHDASAPPEPAATGAGCDLDGCST